MARRPYIEPKIISNSFHPNRSSSKPNEYVAGAVNKEVVGMDGRCDWFRCECRECGQKMITRRKEKRTSYFSCQSCGAWHHQNKEFFDIDRFKTVPIMNDEVEGQLYRVELDYSVSDFDQAEWHYGTEQALREKMSDDTWEVVSDIEQVA